MGLDLKNRQAVAREIAKRYQKATKKQRGQLLDELLALTPLNRVYAAWLLRTHGRRIKLASGIELVADLTKRASRRRRVIYDERVRTVLKRIWLIMDCICGKRLAAALPEMVAVLERHREISIDEQVREKLLRISSATIDRLLAGERSKYNLKGRSLTKPGTLLKSQIPVRTFCEWNEKRPGFVEIDLVGHDGGEGAGDFMQTLDVTDVYSGWTETRAVKNKAQVWVFEAIEQVRRQLPFALLGIDSDNGSEFINSHLLRYCRQQQITFTRSRKYRKNDNCYVEQKNYSVVRRAVGYGRYDTIEHLKTINELYSHLRLYTNYFQPVMKLIEKEREGSKVRKRYDKPRTPYHRLMECTFLSDATKRRMQREYSRLNPAKLKRQITKLQAKLSSLPPEKPRGASRKAGRRPHERQNQRSHFG